MKTTYKVLHLILIAGMLATLAAARPSREAHASSIVVNSDIDGDIMSLDANNTCDLREAIFNANGSWYSSDCTSGAVGPDTITFAGNYTIDLGASLGVNSQVTITGNGSGNTIIQSSNCNPNNNLPGNCTPGGHRVFDVSTGGNLTLNNIIVRHGMDWNGNGGGIQVLSGVLTISNSTISDNYAGTNGGGIYSENSTVSIINSIISDNYADTYGGTGGGVHNEGGTVNIINSSIVSNNVDYGGGIYQNGGSLIVSGSTILNNYGRSNGGGIDIANGNLTISNSTFYGNSTTNEGGGLFKSAGTATITNSTFSGNSSNSYGGGIASYAGTTTLKNTIVADSASGLSECQFNSSALTADGSNLDTDGSCDNATPKTTLQIRLGLLQDNGGPTQTLSLLSGSEAIDAGDSAACANAPVDGKDQRGITRPQGTGCDIGAYEYDSTSTGPLAWAGQWAWMDGSDVSPQNGIYGTEDIPAINNVPGSRVDAASWVDQGDNLWLFGGSGSDSNGGFSYLGDLWKFDPDTRQWTWVDGSKTVYQNGIYGTEDIPAVNNVPGGREGAISWIDGSGNLWLFGGFGLSGLGQGHLNDLWKFDSNIQQWTWVDGSNTSDQSGIYGAEDIPAANNVPGARRYSVSWIDGSGNLWLFGGIGRNSTGNTGYLNDLWKFDPSTGQWIWVDGSNTINQNGIYGTEDIPSANNVPGARYNATSWIDVNGVLWLFGGEGYDSVGGQDKLNDLWKFDPSIGQWTWVDGSNLIGQRGTYGIEDTPAANNVPGARSGSASWIDGNGDLWLFGGDGHGTGISNMRNDMWKFSPSSGQWTWVDGSKTINQGGVYGMVEIPATHNIPGARTSSAFWADRSGNLWLFGGIGYDSTTSYGTMNDLWKFDGVSPTIASIARASTSSTSASNVDFTVTFSDPVTDVDVSDFSLFKTNGITGESITAVSGSGAIYTVSVNTGSGNGTLRVDVPNTALIFDTSLNRFSGLPFTSGESYTIDKTAPTVTSITHASTNPTNAASVDFTVAFSEAVTSVDISDFSLTTTGLAGASISAVSGSGASYIVSASTGSGNGTLRLDIPNTASITDATSNSLTGLPFTSGETYNINKSATFADVPMDYWSWQYIESIYDAGITGGCSTNPLNYCPTSSVTRAQMAVFLLKGIHGSSFAPPAVNGSTGFTDVAADYWAAAWIKQLAAEGITGGCGNGNYCPENTVTRDQMAVFLLKAKYGSSYAPPAVNGDTGFTDIPADYWAAAWIKQLAAEAITGGCGGGLYCPSNPVTRDQMAVFLQKTFNLPLP